MKKHRLIIYDVFSRRMRSKVLLLLFVLLALGIYDQFTAVLGDAWLLIWAAALVVFLLWIYYSFLMRRGAIHVGRKFLRLQGPVFGFKISYGRIYSVTSAQMGQHFPFDSLKGREQGLLEPLYNRACVFIELKGYPRAFRWRRLWFPPYLFGTNRPGIVCVIDDWVALSRDVETARGVWWEENAKRPRERMRSVAAQILELDDKS